MKNTYLNIATHTSKYAYIFMSEGTRTSSPLPLQMLVLISLSLCISESTKQCSSKKNIFLRHTSLVDSSNSNEIIWLISYIAQL